uniref:Cytochrome P450 n=1 Tax=Kalanchoe fedtschenkoi TaxID=63787 RepID=A0A7N0U297_KALFE
MKLNYPFSLGSLCLLCPNGLILIILVKKLKTNNNSFSPKLPPGQRKVFLIGNIHHLVGSLPHRKLKDLADEHGPIMRFKLVAYNCTNVVFSPYGPYWRQLRKICATQLLGVKKVRSFRSVREEEADELISAIKSISGSGKAVNLSKMLSAMTYIWNNCQVGFWQEYASVERSL